MTEQNRASDNRPWIVAVVLALVVAVLALALVRAVSVRADGRANAGSAYAPTAAEQGAVQAAATEAANLLTFSRAGFPADFARALNGTTGNLRKDLQATRATTLTAMTKGGFDLKAKVVESAFVNAAEGKVVALVTVNGTNVNDKGQSTVASPQRLELTMVRSGTAWLATNLISVGIQ